MLPVLLFSRLVSKSLTLESVAQALVLPFILVANDAAPRRLGRTYQDMLNVMAEVLPFPDLGPPSGTYYEYWSGGLGGQLSKNESYRRRCLR